MENLPKENLTGKTTSMPFMNEKGKFLTASSIIGDDVIDAEGENIGSIKDIMINTEHGKIEYVVLQFGGILGFGEKLFSIPFGVLKLDYHHQKFVLNVAREVIENAPGFDQEHWPNTNSHQFDYNYWAPFMGVNTGNNF